MLGEGVRVDPPWPPARQGEGISIEQPSTAPIVAVVMTHSLMATQLRRMGNHPRAPTTALPRLSWMIAGLRSWRRGAGKLHALSFTARRRDSMPRFHRFMQRKQEETDAAHRQEEEALVSLLEDELRALCATDTGMSLLTAVEFITHDPAHRIALYRRCGAEDKSISGMAQEDGRFSKIDSSVAKDVAFLERRAQTEGFEV
jgi:hypothetical protein